MEGRSDVLMVRGVLRRGVRRRIWSTCVMLLPGMRTCWRAEAVDAEVRRLQQQAETEQRVELFAHRLSQQQAHLQPSVGQQRQQQPVPEQQARRAQSHQASEELSGSEDDWEVEEVDDGMVAYAWKSKDELLQQWDEQQHKELNPPAQTRPHCCLRGSAPADERPRS